MAVLCNTVKLNILAYLLALLHVHVYVRISTVKVHVCMYVHVAFFSILLAGEKTPSKSFKWNF